MGSHPEELLASLIIVSHNIYYVRSCLRDTLLPHFFFNEITVPGGDFDDDILAAIGN